VISNKTGTVDFHLHSRASNVTDYYAANAFAIPESYSDPLKLHPLLKSRGMKLVTLTDHNSIDGVRAMLDAGLPDVFISAEMTTTFEDGCNVHVTIANVTEKQFAEANRLRPNIYEMIAYLDAEIAAEPARASDNVITYFMTHPLMSTQNRPYGREGSLTVEHIEKMLLLCNALEVRNGSRTRALNELTLHLLESLDPAMIERLANKHGIEPKGPTPWQKAILSGSDDHAGINPGRTWTEFPHAGEHPVPNDVIRAIRARQTRPAGIHGGPITLAHSLLKLLYDGSNLAKARGGKSLQLGGPLQALLRMVFDSGSQPRLEMLRYRLASSLKGAFAQAFESGRTEPFERILESEVCTLLSDPTFRDELEARPHADDRIFWVVGTLVNRIFARYVENLRQAGTVDLLRAIKELVGLVSSNLFVSLPYLVSFLQQSSDCLIARDARSRFGLVETQKLVLVTDTFFDVNGVAATIRRTMREAIRRNIDFTVVTCLAADEIATHTKDPEIQRFIADGRLKILPAISCLDFPEYEGLKIRFPPFLDLLKYMQEQGFTKVQVSTPGTVGLAALFAAKTLQLETAATYHTCIPEYVENYTRDVSLEALAWKYMILFYHAVDEVIVPSKFIARLLHKRGLRNRKLLILDRWVDVERFHPQKRDVGYWAKHGIENPESLVKFVYVGRVGVEKNLKLVAEAYKSLRETRSDCHLIIVGDGPYRRELERLLSGVPATFTGFLGGEELAIAIASADAKLFPSTTDTWGNAPLEAQASGIPVVVSTVGGPAELMRDGDTGIKVSGRDVAELRAAMVTLMDRETREWMGSRARAFSEAHRVAEPFTAILDAEAYRQRLREKSRAAEEGSPVEEEISLTNLLDGDFERLASGA
jgi:glycosyltransferase involved in cell wall biosynthesis